MLPLIDNPDELEKILQSLPETPGVYKFKNENQEIIYIGKAKNLKKRVASYFQKEHDNARLKLLVKRICDIEIIHVETEFDALLLENSLIKEFQPKYNIRLKDDKSYPWICFSKEPFPRIFITRNPEFEKAICFGPYPSHKMMITVYELVRNIFPLRTCKLNLSEKKIKEGKYRACLQYQIGKCLAPCEGKQDLNDYMKNFEQAQNIIKGNLNGVLKELKTKMFEHSKKLEFEKAQEYKEKIDALKNYQSNSIVVHPSIKNCDVVSIIEGNSGDFYVNYIRVVQGAIIRTHSFELQSQLAEKIDEVFTHALIEVERQLNGFVNEVVVPFYPVVEFPKVKFIVPKAGNKKELLLLSQKNANMFMLEKQKTKKFEVDIEDKKINLLEVMKKDLGMEELPVHIEAFDNSNLQGQHAVSAMVVFINGKPDKSQYRHYNVKTVIGANDYATIEEVVYRRYKRLVDEQKPIPQLIVIDGGKGQLEAAAKSLNELNLLNKVKLIAIAKRLETIYAYNDSLPLFIDKKSPTLKILQHIRDEAHRFGLKHHRTKRNKETLKTQLANIKGIGNKTMVKLIKAFGSIERIKQANFDEIKKIAGEKKAKMILENFSPKTE